MKPFIFGWWWQPPKPSFQSDSGLQDHHRSRPCYVDMYLPFYNQMRPILLHQSQTNKTVQVRKQYITISFPTAVLLNFQCLRKLFPCQESCLFRQSLLRQSIRVEESPKNLLVPFLILYIYRSLVYLCFTTTYRFPRKSFEHFKHSNICSIECTREYEGISTSQISIK